MCAFQCYCASGACNKTTGICPDQQCLPGWKEESCSEGKIDNTAHCVNKTI